MGRPTVEPDAVASDRQRETTEYRQNGPECEDGDGDPGEGPGESDYSLQRGEGREAIAEQRSPGRCPDRPMSEVGDEEDGVAASSIACCEGVSSARYESPREEGNVMVDRIKKSRILEYIDSSDAGTRQKVERCLRGLSGRSEKAFQGWDTWSRESGTYENGETRRLWDDGGHDTLGPGTQIQLGHVDGHIADLPQNVSVVCNGPWN